MKPLSPKQRSLSLIALALLISIGLFWRSEALDRKNRGDSQIVSVGVAQLDSSDETSSSVEKPDGGDSSRQEDDANGPDPAPKPRTSVTSVESSASSIIKYPSHLLNLKNWKLTLPVDTSISGDPDEIKQPKLASFQLKPYFYLTNPKNGVVFRAHAGGATTGNSSYPRSELREMSGVSRASWSNKNGQHVMAIRQAITHLPSAKPHVVAGQIHDGSDDVIQIRLEGKRLFVDSDGDDIGLLDSSYSLGKVFTVKIVAANSRIKVYYNGVLKVNVAESGSGYYFKAGCYTQSNTSKGDSPAAYGEVVIYGLSVSH